VISMHTLCLCVYKYPLLIPEPVFMKLDMYNMTPEPISTAYFINFSHQSVLSVARQRLGKNVTAETNTHTTIEDLLPPSFLYSTCRMEESRRLVPTRTFYFFSLVRRIDRLCGLVVKVPGYRFRGPGLSPGATRFFFSEK
jgi:hypothetical protein